MISAGIAMFIALVFEKMFITILTGALAAVIGFAVLAGPYIASKDSLKRYPEYENGKMTASLDARESIEVMKRYAEDFVSEMKRIFSQMPMHKRAIIAALAVFFIVTGFFKQQLTSAFCCAALGTMLIFGGMILLLLYKGAAPISRICQNRLFYQSIFGIMTAFGMAEQLLLCQRIKGKPTRKKKTKKDGEESEQVSADWRNR
jgi:hypothetical protein